MPYTDSLSDSQIDELLERYDQTAPHLQRRILAEVVLLASQHDDLVQIARLIAAGHAAEAQQLARTFLSRVAR